jgi:dienelactone hydrolase
MCRLLESVVFVVTIAVVLAGCSDDGGNDPAKDIGGPGSDAGQRDKGASDTGAVDAPPTDAVPADLSQVDGVAPDAPPKGPAAPKFAKSSSFSTTIAGTNDPADVYHPAPSDLSTGGYSFPVVLLLQGAKVDKKHYSEVAGMVARHGFVVVVPNHTSLMGLFMELKVVPAVLAHMKTQNTNTSSPVAGVVDASKLGLMGHSYGGVAGLYAIQGQCQIPFCVGGFQRPAELKAGAFYGTNMKSPFGPIPKVANAGIATALIQGKLDGKSKEADTKITYDNIQDPPKAYVVLAGANHFGVCNTNNPPGADADPTKPTMAQTVAVETVARWSAMFLRAYLLGEKVAVDYIHKNGDALDPNVTVTSAK